MARKRPFIELACMKCGNTVAVEEKAYIEGWCIGTGAKKHKPSGWRIVGRTLA